MKNLFANVLMVLLFTCMVVPHSEAASASFSGSMSVTNTPSFSSSLSGSYSATQSYSQTAPLTQTATYSSSLTFSASLLFSRSGAPTISATAGTIVPPPGNYRFENRCPGQSTTVCPFWSPNVFASYRLTIMDVSGRMLTYDNIIVPPLELPQFPVSFDSTDGFIQPGGTYRFQLFGCISPGVCVEAWTPLVVVLNPRRKPVCNPNYICRVSCKLVSGSVQCTWTNTGIIPYKRAILRIRRCFLISSFTRIYPSRVIIQTVRRPKAPIPTSLSLALPVGALCEVQFILRYHPIQPKEKVFKYYFFS